MEFSVVSRAKKGIKKEEEEEGEKERKKGRKNRKGTVFATDVHMGRGD